METLFNIFGLLSPRFLPLKRFIKVSNEFQDPEILQCLISAPDFSSVFKEHTRHFLPLPRFVLLMGKAVWDCGWSCCGTRPEALSGAGVWARIYNLTVHSIYWSPDIKQHT